jgi:ABC-2 type transport system ATP-binding protein
MDTSNVISVEGITKRYGRFVAVDDVSFSVAKGEVVGFVGLNGAGKSTTINLLLGFLRATSGRITLLNQAVNPQTAHRTHRQIGFASGDMALFANLTGKQYFRFLSRRYKLSTHQRLEDLCARFEPQLDKKIGDLSRGNKQKIALIGAFMASPALVILDEPSSGLDPFMQEAFLDLVREEAEKGTTIFMSSHYLNEVADVCSRILLMRKGKLVKDITAHQLAEVHGKLVRIVTHRNITPPVGAEAVTNHQVAETWETTFLYKGSTSKLQQWLAGVPGVIDFTVAEHDLEAAFSDLYAADAGEVAHA